MNVGNDYSMVKTYRGIYHSNEAFKDACHASFPVPEDGGKMDVELKIFIEQEAMYQQLEATYYPCRMAVS